MPGRERQKGMRELERRYDALYELHGKPLEREHKGEFLVVSESGETLLAPTLAEATARAETRFGRGNFVYKVGERAVGRLR